MKYFFFWERFISKNTDLLNSRFWPDHYRKSKNRNFLHSNWVNYFEFVISNYFSLSLILLTLCVYHNIFYGTNHDLFRHLHNVFTVDTNISFYVTTYLNTVTEIVVQSFFYIRLSDLHLYFPVTLSLRFFFSSFSLMKRIVINTNFSNISYYDCKKIWSLSY